MYFTNATQPPGLPLSPSPPFPCPTSLRADLFFLFTATVAGFPYPSPNIPVFMRHTRPMKVNVRTVTREFRKLSIPNQLTILRLLSIPVFLGLVLIYAQGGKNGGFHEGYRLGAAAVFIGLFLLDILDGFIARVSGQVTSLGTILDPVADKALMVTALIALGTMPRGAVPCSLPLWFVVITIFRDSVLLVGALVIHNICHALDVAPRWTGKIAAFFNAVVVGSMLLGAPARLCRWQLVAAIIFTVVSGAQYVRDGMLQLTRKKT